MDPLIERLAGAQAEHVHRELEALVAVSSPSGDHEGAEAAVALCGSFLPPAASLQRVPCSTAACSPDLVGRLRGSGARRLLLLGHIDTVIAHGDHLPLRARDGRLLGPGTVDMKGGVVLALAVARCLATIPERFAEVAVLLVCDEEWRVADFAHVDRFAGFDACLCFEAGERTRAGEDGVIVRRKGAGTLRVEARGRAAHSGSAPQDGRNALLALSRAAIEIAAVADPEGPAHLTVVPTVMRSGEAFNVVPAAGELIFDMRSTDVSAFARARAAVPAEIDGVTLEARMERVWPAMDTEDATAELLSEGSRRLGRAIVPRARGGASDASHFATVIPLTVDGLGPRGGGAHTPDEFIWADSLRQRLEVALALTLAVLDG
ncbi:MAG TPA: M20/M25/M40 family metallo-hydrolase [Solirubrobacteraceae bacterium]|nr:M20/M25/M40 family metallo-hydrolase [Solirubrobacteraceae bacterium]